VLREGVRGGVLVPSRAADAALVHYGLQAASALTHAMARARPDRRQRYAAVLGRITTTYLGSDT
jgi:hypothetical protein